MKPKIKPVESFRKKHKLPTRKQEQDFIKNLKPHEKQFSYKEVVKYPMSNTNWFGIVLYKEKKWYQKIAIRLLRKIAWNVDNNTINW